MARDLVTRAVIQGVDRLSGPFGRMAGTVAATQGRLTAAQAAAARGMTMVGNAGKRMTGMVTTTGAFGLGMMLMSAKDFEKSMFGIGVATIPDAMNAGAEAVGAASEAMDTARASALKLSREMGLSMGNLGDIMEAGVKGGMGIDKIEAFSKAIGTLQLTDPEASAENLAAWGVSMDALYAKAQKVSGISWGDWFAKQADVAAVAAAETQLSTGSLIEGMRQFQALHAAMGVTNETSAALLASGVKAGQNAIEVGQTLKSNALRVLVPTLPNLRAWQAAGLNRSDYFVGEQFLGDPMKIAGTIAQMSGGAISGKRKAALHKFLLSEQAKGTKSSDAAFQEKLARGIAKSMGLDLRNDENRERVYDILGNALFTGKEVDIEKLYRDIAEKKVDPAKVAQMFEGRRVAINQAIFGQIETGFYDEMLKKFGASDGKTLDNTQKVFDNSFFGRVKRMEAALSRFNVRIMSSRGMTSFIESLSNAVEALDKLSPRMIELGTYAGLAALFAGPVMSLASGLFKLGGAALAAARGLGVIGGAMLAWGRRSAILAAAIWPLSKARAVLIGLRTALSFTGVGLGLSLVLSNLGKIKDFFTGFWSGGGAIGGALGNLGTSLIELGQEIGSLFSIDTSAWGLPAAFEAGKAAADGLAAVLRGLASLIGGITSSIRAMRDAWKGWSIDTPDAKRLREATGMPEAEPFTQAPANDNAPPSAVPFGAGEGARSVTVEGGHVQLDGAIPLSGSIEVNSNVKVQGPATVGTSVGGKVEGPANAIPVRKSNATGTGG